MESKNLEVTVNSAEDLKNLRHSRTMNVYVVVSLSLSLSGDERIESKQQTPVHQEGGTNPRWGQAFSFNVDEAAACAGRLTLKFEIKDEHTFFDDGDIGRVDVPIKELLEQGCGAGGGTPKVMRYWVKLPSGGTQGILEISYKFGEPFTMATPSSSSGLATVCPPHAGPNYPPQGYGHPPPGNQRPPAVISWADVPRIVKTMADVWSLVAGEDDGLDDADI